MSSEGSVFSTSVTSGEGTSIINVLKLARSRTVLLSCPTSSRGKKICQFQKQLTKEMRNNSNYVEQILLLFRQVDSEQK